MIWIFLAFGANFIGCWIRIRIRNADPDPGDKSNADSDPKHWAWGHTAYLVPKSVFFCYSANLAISGIPTWYLWFSYYFDLRILSRDSLLKLDEFSCHYRKGKATQPTSYICMLIKHRRFVGLKVSWFDMISIFKSVPISDWPNIGQSNIWYQNFFWTKIICMFRIIFRFFLTFVFI
jgi:hypothetical protein